MRTTALLIAIAALPASVDAGVYTMAGFTFDTANGFGSATGTVVGTNSASMPAGQLGGAGDDAFSFGRLVAGGSGIRRATLGSNTVRNTVTLTFAGGLLLPNLAGDDLVVFEQGDANQPEAYAIAVRKTGDSSFSSFRYEVWDGQEGFQIGTGFDLSDFGLSSTDTIDAVMIMNLVNNTSLGVIDYVDANGVVVTGGLTAPSGTALPTGFGAGKDQLFPLGEYDPDISYLGGLHTLVPAPSAMALLGLSGLAAARRRRN